MKLKEVSIQHFRSLKNTCVKFQKDLTVLIGENNSGKSSVLDLLEYALNYIHSTSRTSDRNLPNEADYTLLDPASNRHADQIEITITFCLEENERAQLLQDSGDQSSRRGQRRAPSLSPSWLNEEGLLKVRVRYFRQEQEPRTASIEVFDFQQGTWEPDVSADRLRGFLPRMERYRAIDYQSPEKIVEKTLKEKFSEFCRQERHLINDFLQRAEEVLNTEVEKLTNYVGRFFPAAAIIRYGPRIDPEKAFLGGEFQIDIGNGEYALSRLGDGAKRQVLMGLMNWSVEVLKGTTGNVIWAYDEPDTNLDYGNQRRFFRLIFEQAKTNPNQQVILCTHSVVMIDAAPIHCLVHLKFEKGETQVISVPHGDETEMSEFRNILGRNLGLTNARLFFERSFLIVEGETEEAAIPILYKKWRKTKGEERTMAEDGIAFFTTKGTFPVVLFRFLSHRVPSGVVILCDREWEDDLRKALNNAGAGFQVVLIGKKEFEDAFSDETWARVCNKYWPQQADQQQQFWRPEDIASIRKQGQKFSENLRSEIQKRAKIKGGLSKAKMGEALAEELFPEEIPQEIQEAFEKVLKAAMM